MGKQVRLLLIDIPDISLCFVFDSGIVAVTSLTLCFRSLYLFF